MPQVVTVAAQACPEDGADGGGAAGAGGAGSRDGSPPNSPPGPQPASQPASRSGSPPDPAAPVAAANSAPLTVEDQLQPRIRIPADILRCAISVTEIALLVGLALLASATTNGFEFDIVGASQRLPGQLLGIIGTAAHLAFLILPAALAIRLLVLRQFRRLAEAIATGAVTVGLVAGINHLLNQPGLAQLRDALHTTLATATYAPTLDGYLAGLAAYVTVIGLRGREQWRTTFWTAVGFYALAGLASNQTTVLALLVALLIGSAAGSGLRYAMGTPSARPTAADIAAALSQHGARIIAIRRVGNGGSEVRRYGAATADGRLLDLTVLDRDQQAADAFYRLYRRLRVRTQVSRSAPLSLEAAIERQALLSYATADAGVPTPRISSVIRVGPDAAVLATEHVAGRTLASFGAEATDDQLRQVWDSVLRLHEHRVTHRALTADRILFAEPDSEPNSGSSPGPLAAVADPSDGQVVLLEPGNGDVAATDLQTRLDLAQLTAETALLVGPDRAADLAIEKLGSGELLGLVPLLQPIALERAAKTTQRRRRRAVLADVRKRLLAAVPDGQVPPVRLERIKPRMLITLLAGVFAIYLVAGQLAHVSFGRLLGHASPDWVLTALLLSAATYVGSAMCLSGFVLERLSFPRTLLVQLAGSFVILVTPPAIGGVALNVRYLRRSRLSAAESAASVGVSQLMTLASYLCMVAIFAAITGASESQRLNPPGWVYIAVAVVAGLVIAVLAFPAGRRLVRAQVTTLASQVIPRLLDMAQRPLKLAEGAIGAVVLTLSYILCLEACVQAFGHSLPVASVALVYLTGNALGSMVPTPGGLGAVEVTLSAGLTAAGLPGAVAVTTVLLFRTVTFWLPVPLGWLAMHHLQRKDVL